MENKLEQLLNNLIEKGLSPIGKEYTGPHKPFISLNGDNVHGLQFYYNERWDGDYRLQKVFTLREIVSINSGLWQFVCENGMVKKEGNSEWTIIYPNERAGDYQKCHSYCEGQSEYWVLESALCDEDKSEDFILSNINIEG